MNKEGEKREKIERLLWVCRKELAGEAQPLQAELAISAMKGDPQ
jgi:hypothetical protein